VVQVLEISEPTVLATILAPADECGPIMQLCTARRGQQLDYNYIHTNKEATAATAATSTSSDSSISSSSSIDSSRESSSSSSGGGGGATSDVDGVVKGSGQGSSRSSSSSSSSGGVFGDRVMLRYQLPLAELAGDFYSKLKSVTHG
jgi:hypothetical protein